MAKSYEHEHMAEGFIEFVDDHIRGYEANGDAQGAVLMYTIGAKSGEIRKAPVMRVEHDGVYLAVASIGGGPKDPAWVFNLRANPLIEMRDKDQTFTVRAKEVLDPEQRAKWWDRAVAAYPPYAQYLTRTARVFPIFTLTRQ